MNFEQLKILVALGEEKNFSRTANRLNLTTSAVSQAVSSLEKELDIKLFNRSKSGSFTTEKGQYILREAMQILSIQEKIYKYSSDKENRKLKIKIGIIPGVSYPLMKALKKLKEEYEFLEVSVEEHDTEILLKGLQSKKYNFAIISFADTIKNQNINYKSYKLIEGDFCFMISKASPLALKNSLSFNDVIKENIAVYNDKFLKNYISYVEDCCTKKAEIFLQSNNINFILNAIEENMAIAPTLNYLTRQFLSNTSSNIKIIDVEKKENFINPSLWFLESTDFSGQTFSKDFLSHLKKAVLEVN
ncbi:LysR family transcriptional regulator [uncultured Clostridium sp.]|uniref:LysR family transcriptional regulator n=1 Tax=uncultured Clostridium sp. TaxID=59620 RepID=UPI002626C629|nr:LysR family transcriptional regulator [uncultured Clostridium sp.]